MRTGWGVVALVFWVVPLAVGCQDQSHVGEGGFYVFAMTEGTSPAAVSEEGGAIFQVEQRVELPIREPTGEQRRMLRQGARDMDLPFERLPWVERGDYEIEVDWVLSNLTDGPVIVDLVVNGFSEFHEYVPAFVVEDDEIIVDFAQWERKVRLEPFERRMGTVREEAFDEATVDLATVANGAPNPNQIMHPDNQSDADVRAQPYIPAVIPALTGFRLGLRGEDAAPLVVEATVRVRDEGGRIVARSQAWDLPEPVRLSSTTVATEEEETAM